jgi:hypothetical protein
MNDITYFVKKEDSAREESIKECKLSVDNFIDNSEIHDKIEFSPLKKKMRFQVKYRRAGYWTWESIEHENRSDILYLVDKLLDKGYEFKITRVV